jgi:hypothetical protein
VQQQGTSMVRVHVYSAAACLLCDMPGGAEVSNSRLLILLRWCACGQDIQWPAVSGYEERACL